MRLLAAGALLLVLAGCGSSVGDTPSPVTSPGPQATGACAAIPTIDPNNPPDTLPLTADPTLEAEFPTQIDGQDVTDLASGRWLETLCMLGGQASVDAAQLNLPPGLDLSPMTVASATATVDGSSVTIVAYRLPGHGADEILGVLGDVSGALSSQRPTLTSSLSPATAGGKDVSRWTNPADGTDTYVYASGDTLWMVRSIDESQADKIFATLP